MVGITELRTMVDSKQSLEERLKVTMRAALGHWLITDEESQFKMAVGAVLVEAREARFSSSTGKEAELD